MPYSEKPFYNNDLWLAVVRSPPRAAAGTVDQEPGLLPGLSVYLGPEFGPD